MTSKSLTDISYVTYQNTRKLDVLNLNYKNINHANKITFEVESSRFINFNFGKRVSLKNIQILSGSQYAVESTVWYKRRGVPHYSRYFENTSKFDIIDQDDIILELNFTQPTPSLFFYDPDYTDNIFTVDENNNTHIIWYYKTQSPDSTNSTIKRYSNNIPIGTYSIYEFNKQLFNVFLDGRIFKEEYPIEIIGKYPKLKLNLHSRSKYSIIIDKDSPLFTYLGITQGADLSFNPDVSYGIPFTFDPYSNTEFVMRYNNFGKYDIYRTGATIAPFISHIPITDESGNIITYTTSEREIRINLLETSIIEVEGKVLLEESITNQLTSGLFTYFNDISCNNINSNYFTSNSINTNDASFRLLDISGTLYSKNMDSSNIIINRCDISNTITASNLYSNDVNVNLINSEFIDISNGYVKLNNSSNFNISYNKYKFIRFDLIINNLNTDKSSTFNNLKFYDIGNNNPLFRVWTLSNNNYTLVNTIYDNSINYTGDASSIIFDFKNPVPQGISFSYNKNDIGKIFKIDSSNNNIHYKPTNNSHIGSNNIIQAQIPDNSYDLVGINLLLTQQHGGTSVNPNVRTTSAGGVRVKIGNNQFEDLVTDISYTIVDKNTYNTTSSPQAASVNIIRDFLRFKNTNPLRPYEEFVYFSSNKTQLLFFIDNSSIDVSYSLLYDSSYSFFKHFFEPDISFITPNDLKSGATVFWNENTGAETSNDAPLTLLNSNTDWNLNLRDPSNNIDISGNTSVSDNSGNIFAALLTIRDEFVQNPEIIPYYKNDTYTDISSGEWTAINYNKHYKNRFFLSDYSNNYLDYSSNNIYISIPYTADIIYIDNSSNVLLKHKLDSQGPTYDSSLVNLNKNSVIIEKNIIAKDIYCLDISLSNIFGNKEYLINNLDVSNNCNVKNIETYINNDPSYIGFSTTQKITKMANYISTDDISNSGFRMEIGPEISGNNAGWYIKMIGDNNSNNSGDAALIFRPKDILGLNNTWFDMSCDLVLSNSAFNNVSDDRYKHNERDISNAILTVKQITPKTYIKTRNLYDYSYNIDINNIPPGTTYESGYIAQDILTIPELIHVVQNGYKLSVNYNGIQPYLCKAIQELYAEVLSLESQIQIHENT